MAGTYVKGLRETVRSLERMGVAVSDLKGVFSTIGQNIVSQAQALAPVKTGTLRSSIKASKTKNKSVVRAGGAKVPYAGVIHYGGYNHIEAQPFLTDAVTMKEQETVHLVEAEIRKLIQQYGLK